MPRKTSPRHLAAFLDQLAGTGNLTLAAERANLARSGIHKRRKRDAAFRRACDEAFAAFRTSLSRSDGEGDHVKHGGGAASLTTLTRPSQLTLSRYAGRPQRRRLPAGRLTSAGTANFFAALANTANIRLAAKAVGVAPSSIHARRRTDPDFEEQLQAALAIARSHLECALIQAADRAFDQDWAGYVDAEGPKMTVGQSLRFLQVRRRL